MKFVEFNGSVVLLNNVLQQCTSCQVKACFNFCSNVSCVTILVFCGRMYLEVL